MAYIFTLKCMVSFPVSGLSRPSFGGKRAPCPNHVIVVDLLSLAVT